MLKGALMPRLASLVLLFMLMFAGCDAPPPATTSVLPIVRPGYSHGSNNGRPLGQLQKRNQPRHISNTARSTTTLLLRLTPLPK
jgi:hypothetical protein